MTSAPPSGPETVPSFGLWGPPGVPGVEGFTPRPPRKKQPWGLVDVVWSAAALLAAQVVLLPILVVIAIQKYGVETDSAAAIGALSADLTKVATTGPGLIAALVTQWMAFVSVPVWASHRKGWGSLAKDFGVRFKWTDPLFGLLIAAALEGVMAAISWGLNHTSLDLKGASNTDMVTGQHGIYLVVMIVAATVGAPLTEELLFRGLILRAFLRKFARLDLAPPLPGVTDRYHAPGAAPISQGRRRVGIVLAALFSSMIFGLMHLQTGTGVNGSVGVSLGAWVVVAQTGLLGLVFACIAIRMKRIGLTMFTHFFFNSASIVLVLLTTR